MLEDLKKWVAEGRDIDREYKDVNGATPVRIFLLFEVLPASPELLSAINPSPADPRCTLPLQRV